MNAIKIREIARFPMIKLNKDSIINAISHRYHFWAPVSRRYDFFSTLNTICLLITGVNFLVWDVGGQEKLRPLWKSYTRCTDGIIFVVDSCDTERLEEAKMELTRTARSPDNAGVPILILANKQDLPGIINIIKFI